MPSEFVPNYHLAKTGATSNPSRTPELFIDSTNIPYPPIKPKLHLKRPSLQPKSAHPEAKKPKTSDCLLGGGAGAMGHNLLNQSVLSLSEHCT